MIRHESVSCWSLWGSACVAAIASGATRLAMKQRLGNTAALLGDPDLLILTSPPTVWTPPAYARCVS